MKIDNVKNQTFNSDVEDGNSSVHGHQIPLNTQQLPPIFMPNKKSSKNKKMIGTVKEGPLNQTKKNFPNLKKIQDK